MQPRAATATPVTLAELARLRPTSQAAVRKSGSLATLASAAGHAIFVFALIYAAGSAGRPDHDAETPVEIEIIVEPAAASRAATGARTCHRNRTSAAPTRARDRG